jgi:hypothetical protein
MTPTRILPDLQCSLICEEVRQEANGNFFLIGVLNYVRVQQLPITAMRLTVFTRWTAGLGQFTETIRLIAPDQTTLMRKAETKFQLADPAMHATNVAIFGQVEFKTAGHYFVEVLVDDVMKIRYPLTIIHQPPQPKPAGQPGQPAGNPPAEPDRPTPPVV